MTIDKETKDYIDEKYSSMSIKVSSFFSALCETLEQKKVLNPGEFNQILEKASIAAQFAQALGAGKMGEFEKIFSEEVKKQTEKLYKESKERKWDDLR